MSKAVALVFALLSLSLSLSLSLAITARADQTPSLRIEPLENAGDGAWLVTHTDAYASNSLLVECAGGTLVLCDTPMTEAATLELLAWAKNRFGERRWIVVNGHFHADCTAGNAAMIDAGAEVLASDLTASLQTEHARAQLDSLAEDFAGEPLEEEFRATRVRPATRTFPLEEPQTLPVEGERVEIIHPGPAHALDNVLTHFPERRIVFAGCMCFSADREGMGYIGNADIEAWPAALARVQRLGATVVVPGHGAPGGPELLRHTADVVARHAGAPDPAP